MYENKQNLSFFDKNRNEHNSRCVFVLLIIRLGARYWCKRATIKHRALCTIRAQEKARFLCQGTGKKHAKAQIRHTLGTVKAHFKDC